MFYFMQFAHSTHLICIIIIHVLELNLQKSNCLLMLYSVMCLTGAVANVADSGRCNPKVSSSIPAGGKDFP